MYQPLAGSQELWQAVSIAESPLPHRRDDQDFDAYWDRRLARRDGECKLASMKRYDFLAEKWHSLSALTNVPERERQRLRDRYAKLYLDAVGVTPDLQVDFRAALTAVVEQGDRTVEDLVAEFRHRCYSSRGSPLGSSLAGNLS